MNFWPSFSLLLVPFENKLEQYVWTRLVHHTPCFLPWSCLVGAERGNVVVDSRHTCIHWAFLNIPLASTEEASTVVFSCFLEAVETVTPKSIERLRTQRVIFEQWWIGGMDTFLSPQPSTISRKKDNARSLQTSSETKHSCYKAMHYVYHPNSFFSSSFPFFLSFYHPIKC